MERLSTYHGPTAKKLPSQDLNPSTSDTRCWALPQGALAGNANEENDVWCVVELFPNFLETWTFCLPFVLFLYLLFDAFEHREIAQCHKQIDSTHDDKRQLTLIFGTQ